MFGIASGTAADYHELNVGAHRKPPKVLSAPSLVWHLAFWTNFQELDGHGEPLRNDDGSPKKKTSKQVRDALDGFIVGLHNVIANHHVDGEAAKVQLAPCVSGTYLLFGNAFAEQSFAPVPASKLRSRQKDILESTSRTVTLQFVWRKLDVTIRFEVRTEYFCISTFVELDKDRVKARNSQFSSIPELNSSIASILKYLNGPDYPSRRDEDEELVVRINKFCFHDFWKIYQQEILSDKSLTACGSDVIFRYIFADFRGFIASDQAVKFPDDEFFKDNKSAKWGWNAKKRFLPLIQHRDRTDRSRHECAVNYMLDGRALYMSTLGPPLQHPSMSESERIPVEFIVYAHQRFNDTTIVNKWQLGRLISHILLLGTLRLCALKDVKLLHEAGQQLGLLEESTQKAREAIALTETDSSTPAGDTVSGTERKQSAASRSAEAMRRIAEAHRKLNDITGTFLKKTGTGPLYRIERSRYYVQQFDENVKLLRIRRLEGDQPYDQFIRRRLGSEFDFINRLGIRYERATGSIVTLDQNYLAITQNSLVERATKIDEETNSIQSDIQKIQRWGEFVLLAVLVPYYFMHLLVLLLGEDWPGIPSITFVTWGLFFIFAFFRMFRESKRVWLFWSFVGILSIIEFAGIVVFVETVIPGKANPPVADAHSSTLLTQIIKSQRRLEKLLDAQLGTSERQSNPVQSGPAAPPAAVPGPATPVPEHASPVPQTPATPMPAPAER
jgi:hypothetical protein